MRVLLVSTYELGHQPLHVASPAGALLRAGHEVRCLDLAVEPFDPDLVAWADGVACSVPMHTAMRLARDVARDVRARHPDMPLCFYGLYAGLDVVGGRSWVDVTIAGEYEPELLAWARSPGASKGATARAETTVALGRGRFGLPARHLLPPLARYAHLAIGRAQLEVGYVEASHGCVHRCRHCPVPVVYDGRTRLVDEEAVVADVAQLVDMGARHVTFGDPDFLNGPHHARRVVDAVHASFPDVTFDLTAKVEHILRHRGLWPALSSAGCLFVVTAFESAEPHVLALLAKSHDVADEVEAVAVLRSAGIEPRPSLLPFTPWTTAGGVLDLLDLVARCDLVGNIDPVQYAIRLLVPPGSLLLRSGVLAGRLGAYEPERLGWAWVGADPALDELQLRLAQLAEQAAIEQWPAAECYGAVRATTTGHLAVTATRRPPPPPDARLRAPWAPDDRPRLTESWFCCAEPTDAQFAAVRTAEPDTALGVCR